MIDDLEAVKNFTFRSKRPVVPAAPRGGAAVDSRDRGELYGLPNIILDSANSDFDPIALEGFDDELIQVVASAVDSLRANPC